MLHRCACHGEPIIAQAPPPEAADHAWPRTESGTDAAGAWDTATTRRLLARDWRQRWHVRQPPRWWLLAAVAVLHLLFAYVTLRTLGLPLAQHPSPDEVPLQIRFVSILTTPAPPPPPAAPPQAQTPPTPAQRTRTPAATPMVAATVAAPAAPTLHLYATDGRILLPAAVASRPAPVAGNLQGDTHIMRGYDPLHYKPTPFEPYFPPLDESAGGAAVRRVVDTVIKTKEINLPRGIHLQCKTVLGIPTPDCMIPPPTVSPKAGDARLNMAPAAPLAGPATATSAPAVADCIEIYRAGKPLPWGCPVDTPTRAVDAELKAKARRQGG